MNPYFESEYRESRMMHSCPGVIYVVKQGDTLYKISQYHHVSVTDILLANPYVNVYNLQIGDELCIPVAEAAECVKDIDTSMLTMLGYEGSSYTLYEDDGVHKEYDKAENYRELKK